MNLHIIAIGKKKSEYDAMINEYKKRITTPFTLTLEIIQTDTAIEKIKPGDYVIALDEHGKEFTTVGFSRVIDKLLQSSPKRIVFVIGESHGLESSVRDRANMTLCLGKFTLPHELARLIIVEQLYRTTNYLSGGKYHHE